MAGLLGKIKKMFSFNSLKIRKAKFSDNLNLFFTGTAYCKWSMAPGQIKEIDEKKERKKIYLCLYSFTKVVSSTVGILKSPKVLSHDC